MFASRKKKIFVRRSAATPVALWPPKRSRQRRRSGAGILWYGWSEFGIGRPFILKLINLPRGAQDKHLKNATKWDACCFLQVWSEFIGIAPQDRVVGNPYRDIR